MSSIKHVVNSMLSGYVVVAIQAVIGIAMTPYLLAENALGMEKYGLLMLIQSSIAILSVLLDGFRLETAKTVGKSTNTNDQVINEIRVIALILSTFIGSIYIFFLFEIAPTYIHNITNEILIASMIFIGAFVLEQMYYSIDSYFHAIKKSILSNALSIIDSITRATLILIFFEFNEPTIINYAYSVFLSLSIKYLLSNIILRKFHSKPEQKITITSIIKVIKLIKDFPGQTLQGISPYLIFRGAVILSGWRLGAEQAAVVAIFIQTIRNYFNQAVFSGLRPFILPYLSAIESDKSQRTSLNKFIFYYQIVVFIVGVCAATTAEYWFPLWLGEDLGKYYHLTWIVFLGYSFEVAFLFHYYDLIAKGQGIALAYLTFLGSIITLLAINYFQNIYNMIELYLWAVTAYILYWSLLVAGIKAIKG